jgi:anaerobic selenocysteine-containing dehydrogenase
MSAPSVNPRGVGLQNWRWRDGEHTVTRSICWSPPGCHGGCGCLLRTDSAGRLVGIEGDPANPFSQGALCARGLATLDTVHHPERLLHPLRRDGPRGAGRWRAVGWDEALAEVATGFDRIRRETGPESVLFLKGTGRDVGPWISRLAYSFGSPNYFALGPASGNACFMPRTSVGAAAFGGFMVPDCSQHHLERYDHPAWRPPATLVIWGGNPVVTNPDGFLGAWIVHCMERGTELVVVDPRLTWLAARARHWLPLRPGTDVALALAFLHVILAEGLYDAAFVARWTYGFEALAARVAPCTPAWAAGITGLDAERIAAAARHLGRSRPAAFQQGLGVDMSPDAAATAHAVGCLWAVLGQVEVPGGMLTARDPFGVPRRGPDAAAFPQVRRARIGLDRYPLIAHGIPYGQGDALLDQGERGAPYPLRAAWVQGTNTIVSSFADPARADQLLKKLELVVVLDLFHTPTTTAFADLVLPVCTFAERDGLRHSFYQLAAINQALPPRGESRSDMEICLALGRRLAPADWPWEQVHGLFDHVLGPAGLTFHQLRERMPLYPGLRYGRHERGELRADGQPGFETPTGRLELYSTVLESCGLDPLPAWNPGPYHLPEAAGLRADFPLDLMTGARVPALFNAEHLNVPALRAHNPDPLVHVHPRDARAAGLSDGDWAWVVSHHGRCRRCVAVTEEVSPGTAHAQARAWEPSAPAAENAGFFLLWDLNVNLLLPSHLQGPSGFGYPFRSQRCRLEPAEPP